MKTIVKTPKQPKDYSTINPFIITKDAQKYIEFVVQVFGGKERKEGFTVDTDNLVLHAEKTIGFLKKFGSIFSS